MTEPTSTLRSLATRFFHRGRLACMAVSLAPLACMLEGEDIFEDEAGETGESDDESGESDGPPDFPAQPPSPEIDDDIRTRLANLGISEPGDIWLEDCNVCMLTQDSASCTTRDCTTFDRTPHPVSFCEDGLYGEGDIWSDGCNTCLCTTDGTVCTASACEEVADNV